jgi:hypothetical protein
LQPVATSKLLPTILARRQKDLDELPSQISNDEWGEVQKYSKIIDAEIKSKEKCDYLNKQRLVKQTLDK